MHAGQIQAQHNTIDLNAREKFEREIDKGYAGISLIDSITNTVKAIPVHNREFRDGKRGPRDAQRAKVHFESAQLPGGEQRVLAFYLELGTRGKLGSVVPQEIAADAIRRTTGGACAPRTYRRHMAALCRRGWLSKSLVPTGTRVMKDDGSWTTYKVNKVTLSPAARLLIQKTYITLPRPKRPRTERDTRTRGDVLTFPSCSVSDKKLNLDRRVHVVTGKAKELPEGNGYTSPSPASPPQTVKHQASRGASRKAANKAAAVRPAVSARKTRAGIPRTWRTARRTLLAELFAFFHDDPIRDELLRVAELQTDPRYPSAMMTALDWDDIVRRWMQLKWHARRRTMKNEIAPPLRAFCAHLLPPEIPAAASKSLAEQRAAHSEMASWLQVIPDKIPATVPNMVRERMDRERDRLNMLVRAIHAGRVSLSVLSGDDHTLLHQAGHIWGQF